MAMQQVTKTERQKIKLIYGGDIGADPCDFAMLSLLHEYQRHGLIELLREVGELPGVGVRGLQNAEAHAERSAAWFREATRRNAVA